MDRWASPPLGFEERPSALEGVRVYAPVAAPTVAAAPVAPRTLRCPSCGSPTAFDPGVGAVKCEYCEWVDRKSAARVGRAAASHEFTLEALQRAEHGWGVVRREAHCDSCGADLAVEDGALSATCAFCLSNRILLRDRVDDDLRPQVVIPFAIRGDALADPVRAFLAKGWFLPSDLAAAARIETFRGIYLPFWFFSSALSAPWQAEVGHTRTETYYQNGKRRTRTRTVWKRESGHYRGRIDDLAVCASSRLARELIDGLRDWRPEGFADYAPGLLAGFQAQSYDVGLVDAWAIGRADLREAARRGCVGQASTQMVRNFVMTCDLDDEAWRYGLAPVWIATYRYQGKTYQILVNGQTGKVVGQRPTAWWKVWVAMGLMLTPGLGLVLVSLPLLFFGVGLFPLLCGLAFVWIGGSAALVFHRRMQAQEAAE